MESPIKLLPQNMTRVLTFTKVGTMQFSYYKDGMFRHDGSKDWTHPECVLYWKSISEIRALIEPVVGTKIVRNCDHCGTEYQADIRNLNRGWGLCCSKSCAAKKRERSKPGYDFARVAENNERRANWVQSSKYHDDGYLRDWEDHDPGDSEYWDNKDY